MMRFSFFPIVRFKIHGHSMEPTIKNGSFVLVNKWATPKVGNVIAFEHSGKVMIKRITRIQKRKYFVEGDNKNDSLKIGAITKEQIIGKVIQ